MQPYDFTDYKSYLRAHLHEKKTKISGHYTFERMAMACRVQKTYRSRVLNSEDTHLNDDQLFLACKYLGVSGNERSFLFLLRDYSRTQISERKEELKTEIESRKRSAQKSEHYLQSEVLSPRIDSASYHLDPYVMLTHIFLAIERFQQEPRQICEFLNISEGALTDILSQLESMKYIRFDGKKYCLEKQSTHLSPESVLYRPYRNMQRLVALERIQRLSKERSYNFSVVFSANENVRAEIRTKFLKFLQDVEKLATGSTDEHVYQMNFDLFDWSLPL